MAESGCPAPETLPLEVTSSPALGTNTSKSPTSVGGSTPQQEEQHKSSSSISVCLGSKQDEGHSETSTPELAAHRNGVRPHSNAEMCSFQWAGSPGGTVDRRPCADEVCSAVWKENHVASCKQSMQRSHSDNPHVAREASGPWVRETGFPCQWVNFCSQKTSGCPSLVCKQAVELQRSNTVTVCQCGSGSTRPLGGVRICVPSPEEVDTAHDGCREACYGPHAHACSLGDACAAYCHHLPIPAPMPLPPRLVDAERGGQRAPHHHADRLAFPRLVTSISETGLDAKSVTCCCGGDCVERGTPQPREGRRIRDVGTMTSRWELKDVGVQAGHPRSATPPHVFPEVSLMEETETGRPATQKSPVREVAWDAEGMTWEVYGASVDPEELGLAIQKHLELQIKETASRASRLARQDTTSSQQSGRHRKRGGSVIRSLGNPACCVRSSTTVD